MATTYKCLNPVGIQEPIEVKPLAPRLDTIQGKTIYVCINAGGDQDMRGIEFWLWRGVGVDLFISVAYLLVFYKNAKINYQLEIENQ